MSDSRIQGYRSPETGNRKQWMARLAKARRMGCVKDGVHRRRRYLASCVLELQLLISLTGWLLAAIIGGSLFNLLLVQLRLDVNRLGV